ncbi:hypothetical protein EJB05_26260, partial [Eragrostis curvula]
MSRRHIYLLSLHSVRTLKVHVKIKIICGSRVTMVDKYIIVIDDIWENKSWDETIELALVENNCGGRIIITTRNSQVATEISDEVYKMQPLSYENSKRLFCTRIFGDEVKFPDNLPDDVPNKILQKCDDTELGQHRNKAFDTQHQPANSVIVPKSEEDHIRGFLKALGSLRELRAFRSYIGKMDERMERDLVLSLRNVHKLQQLKFWCSSWTDADTAMWGEAGFVLPPHLQQKRLQLSTICGDA